MPEYIFAAMIFFCQIKVALRSCRPSVANAGVRLNKLATRGRRVVCRRRCRRRFPDGRPDASVMKIASSPSPNKERQQKRRRERQDSWLYFGSLFKPVPTSQASAPYLRNRKKKKLPWVPIKIGYFKRRALPGAGGAIKRWPYERKEGIKCVCTHQVKPVVPFFFKLSIFLFCIS